MRLLAARTCFIATLLFLFAASAQYADAACPEPREFPAETLFICTPGINEDCGAGWWHFYSFPYHGDSSIFVEDLKGAYWAAGSGDPLVGLGNDNGFWEVEEWAEVECRVICDPYLGCMRLCTPPTLSGDWTADPMVDGCIDDAGECMVVMLADQYAGVGFFALLSARGGTPFDLKGICQIDVPFSPDYCWAILAPIPRPEIGRLRRSGISSVKAIIDIPSIDDLAAGLYTDRRCDMDPIIGYNLYLHPAQEDGEPPVDRDIEAGWIAITREPLPLGESTAVRINCRKSGAVYLAGSLVFESGFETPYLSANSEPLSCNAPVRVPPGSHQSPYKAWSPFAD